MLTNLRIRNFKKLDEVDIPLGTSVVFIGPNDSGKTAALQALALWNRGLLSWQEKYRGKPAPRSRPVVTINRRDLIAISVPKADLLWRNLRTRLGAKVNGKPGTRNVRIDIVVDGISDQGESWSCGLEFDYANPEAFYCRPLRVGGEGNTVERMQIPPQALQTKVAYLPPMSGLAAEEPRLELGRINVLIGEGQTAQVLRNLCHNLAENKERDWRKVQAHIQEQFGVILNEPEYIAERGEITMSYSEPPSTSSLALSSSGRGLQQTLLLLAYLYANPQSVLLLDEPDAHLEILRQRENYRLLSDIAHEVGSQIIAASHSEVILNEAAGRDIVVAFVGKPHSIGDNSSQVLKALREIGFQDYLKAEQKGWVLYLEGSTDLSILQALAAALAHPAAEYLALPFARFVDNQPLVARRHFHGLYDAKSDLVGIGVYDRGALTLEDTPNLLEIQWKRKEIENYFAVPSILLRYARASVDADSLGPGPLLSEKIVKERDRRDSIMRAVIEDNVTPIALRDPVDVFWRDGNDSRFLDRIFREFYKKLYLYNPMSKSTYHRLAALAKPEDLDEEVTDVLDQIVEVAKKARPAVE